jgi:prolyl-tRNA synthetase
VVRPTSETIIGTIIRRYIQSHRDLPLLTNQWCNVVRWEMRTRLFLRSAEFLWQEGHTFHADGVEAEEEVARILEYYRQVAEDWLAMPVITGQKSRAETFAGAEYSLSIEAMMRDGLALQSGTSHYLGQNFTRAYDIAFTNRANARELCHSTSWGISTRLVGGVIMAHGDDTGLILPPRVAPVQVVIVPIRGDAPEVAALVERVERELRAEGVRVQVDRRDERPGEKFNHWELKGVPLRIELGPKDAAAGQVTIADRITREKRPVPVEAIGKRIVADLDDFQRRLYQRALDFRNEHTVELSTLAELKTWFESNTGFAWAPWCEDPECEIRVREETGGVTTRNFDPKAEVSGQCLVCGRPARRRVAFARSY